MIDYEKIKLAYALAYKYSEQTQSVVRISISISYALGDFCCALSTAFGGEKSYSNIDEIVSVLQELTKPKTKYEVGQEIYYCDYHNSMGPIVCEKVIKTYVEPGLFGEAECRIETACFDLPERLFYPTRESLIEDQIRYWNNLKKNKEMENK